MDKLSGRQTKLLKVMLSEKTIDIDDICNAFNISKRTVYREIAVINEFNKKYKLKIISNKKNLIIQGNKTDLEKLKLDMIGYKSEIEAYERKKFILSELLQLKEPVKLEYFGRKFGVSNATISYDIKELGNWLKSQGLTLVTKPGYGVSLEGTENSFRRAIANFLYENVDTNELMDFLKTGYLKKERLDRNIDMRLLNLIDYETVLKIEKAILKLEKEIDYEIAESTYLGLTVHLALALERIKKGEKIKIGENNLTELKNTPEYVFAEKLASYLEHDLNIKIPEDELGYVTVHLLGAKYRAQTQQDFSEDVEQIALKMIEKAQEVFKVNFSKDELLLEGLKSHLGPTLYRLKMGLDIRNPLINDIKAKYSKLFKYSKEIAKVLEDKLYNISIPEDEIGYIAMHFGAAFERMNDNKTKFNIIVVCASGIGTSRMLMSKLKMFPQLNIVDTVSSIKLNNIKEREDIDLIVSTIPLELHDKKVVIVNPLLLDEDIQKLKKALGNEFYVKYIEKDKEKAVNKSVNTLHIAQYGYNILETCKNVLFGEVIDTSPEKIIDYLLRMFYENRLIVDNQTEKIKKRLIERESMGKIILPTKGFVIFHCTIENLDFPLVAVGKIMKNVLMKNLLGDYEKIKTAFLMIAPEDNITSIEVLGDLSVSLIENSKLVDEINSSRSKEEVSQHIQEALMVKYLEEIKRNIL
ncbi:MAG: BglG family transcription antiterminator [Thermoanaerobacteraceae bacterium]